MNFLLILLISALSFSVLKVKNITLKRIDLKRKQHQNKITLHDKDSSTIEPVNKEESRSNTIQTNESEMSPGSEFPNCVGKTGEEAKSTIEGGGFDDIVLVQIVEEGMMVTMDYREDRVRIWVDGNGKVTRQPTRG